jgi:branched-chain amino acid transport system substrate-binding protein
MASRKLIKFAISVILSFFFISIPFVAFSKDSIRIGAARPLSGPLAFYEANAFGPLYKMWAKEVNAKGGIYVKEYGKRLPVEMIVYDDKSDMGTMTRLLEKLIVQDKVDFILPPASTAFLFAAAAVTNKHKYVLIGAEGGATSMEELMPNMPYFFGVLNFSDWNQMPVLAEIFQEKGVKTVAMMYIDDLHGLEYRDSSTREFKKAGIKIRMVKGVPPDIKDVSAILKEAKRLNVDAFLSFSYPPLSFTVLSQAMELGINFNAFVIGPGACFEVFQSTFGRKTVEGVMGDGAWNAKSSKAAKDFVNKYLKDNKRETLDWWGHLHYWAGLEIFEQAIVKAGTLNQKKIRDIIATEKFDTVLGQTYFTIFGKNGGGLLAKECFAGQIGQWQKGVFEVIDPGNKRTAKPIYPKPDWPKPKK